MSFLPGIFTLLPHIILLVAAILYVSKRPGPEGFLMAGGVIINVISSFIFTIGFPMLSNMGGLDPYQSYLIFVSAFSTLGSFAFAIGLLMLIRKVLDTRATN
jgi:hypothetical protein